MKKIEEKVHKITKHQNKNNHFNLIMQIFYLNML